jgi:hypothetical protein
MSYRRHAVRRLNPFRGIARVVEGADARATSTDGVNWELQILAERPAGWGSLNASRTETPITATASGPHRKDGSLEPGPGAVP